MRPRARSPGSVLAEGARLVREAQERWRLPAAIVDEPPAGHDAWLAAGARAAVDGAL